MVYKPTQRRVAVPLKHPRTWRLDPIAGVPTPRNAPPTLLCHSERSHRGLGPRRSEDISPAVKKCSMWNDVGNSSNCGKCFAPLNPDRSQVKTPALPKPRGRATPHSKFRRARATRQRRGPRFHAPRAADQATVKIVRILELTRYVNVV